MIEQTLTHPWNLPPIPQTGTSWKNLMAVLPPCGWQKPYPLTKPLISRNLRRSHSNHISKSSTAELPILSMPVCFTKFQPVFRSAKALSAHEAANFKKLAAEPFQSHFQILDGRASNSFNASLLHQVSASIPPL